jgi:hypothetical protein
MLWFVAQRQKAGVEQDHTPAAFCLYGFATA